MAAEITNTTAQPAVRPLFLTILCVLTFIGSLVGIVNNVRGYFNADAEVERIASGKSKSQLKSLFAPGSNPADELVRIGNLNPPNYQKFSIGGIFSYILCLVGSVLIFKLKRTGFYSFTLGTFFNLLTHFLLFGDNVAAMGVSILIAIGGLVFIILFGMNLKYMEEDIQAEED